MLQLENVGLGQMSLSVLWGIPDCHKLKQYIGCGKLLGDQENIILKAAGDWVLLCLLSNIAVSDCRQAWPELSGCLGGVLGDVCAVYCK